MKKKSSISLGPGAASLILIFVVLAMAILAMLSLITARNDLKLSDRSARVAEAVYRLNEAAEARRGALDTLLVSCAGQAGDDGDYLNRVAESLPEGVALEGRLLCWEETDGARTLTCALRVEPLGSAPRAVWVRHVLSAEIAGGTDDPAGDDGAVFADEDPLSTEAGDGELIFFEDGGGGVLPGPACPHTPEEA